MRAGRKTRSRASSATTVGEVQSNEMPATASGAIPLWAIAFLTAATRHAHHSAGFCSAQPGCGCFKAYGSAAKVIGVPSGSKIPTRMLSVPPSNQRTYLRTYSVTCFVYLFIWRRVLRAEERIPGHVQRLIFGNDRVQVAQQGEIFGFDDPAPGELGQGAPDDHDRCRAL